jgi:hypothetical protein
MSTLIGPSAHHSRTSGAWRPESARQNRVWPRAPQSIILIAAIVIGLIITGLVVGELYARHRAEGVVASAVECAVHDKADVSFGATPLLLELATGHVRNVAIHTAGNRLGDARGMRADARLNDIRLNPGPDSADTADTVDAVITWSADGMGQTIREAAIPLRGLVTEVKTNPIEGTVKLQGNLGSVTTRPQIVDGRVALHVVDITGLPSLMPSGTVQSALNALTSRLMDAYPAEIHADSVQITKSAVIVHYSAHNVSITQAGDGRQSASKQAGPRSTDSQEPCGLEQPVR